MRGATLIRNGLPWVATNTDLTLPIDDGLAPGHGLLVRLISDFAQVTPRVAGKPERPLLDETRLRVGGDHPLMVGDRLDTDIEGAHRVGTDALLVMTGVSALADLVRARADERPTWIGHDLTALSRPGVAVTRDGASFRAGPWVARVEESRLVVEGRGGDPAERDAWWTAVAAAAWEHLDRTGQELDTAGATPPGSSSTAR
jgi:hypothetical protein